MVSLSTSIFRKALLTGVLKRNNVTPQICNSFKSLQSNEKPSYCETPISKHLNRKLLRYPSLSKRGLRYLQPEGNAKRVQVGVRKVTYSIFSALLLRYKIWYIKKEIDNGFDVNSFITGALQALYIVTGRLVSGDSSQLSEILTPTCLDEVRLAGENLVDSDKKIILYNRLLPVKVKIVNIDIETLENESDVSGTLVKIDTDFQAVEYEPWNFIYRKFCLTFQREYRDQKKGDWIVSSFFADCIKIDK